MFDDGISTGSNDEYGKGTRVDVIQLSLTIVRGASSEAELNEKGTRVVQAMVDAGYARIQIEGEILRVIQIMRRRKEIKEEEIREEKIKEEKIKEEKIKEEKIKEEEEIREEEIKNKNKKFKHYLQKADGDINWALKQPEAKHIISLATYGGERKDIQHLAKRKAAVAFLMGASGEALLGILIAESRRLLNQKHKITFTVCTPELEDRLEKEFSQNESVRMTRHRKRWIEMFEQVLPPPVITEVREELEKSKTPFMIPPPPPIWDDKRVDLPVSPPFPPLDKPNKFWTRLALAAVILITVVALVVALGSGPATTVVAGIVSIINAASVAA